MIGKMENDYWKMYLWNSPTIGMIWSLILHVEHPPSPILPNKLSPIICHKKLLEKGPSIFYGERYALAPLEHHVRVYAPSIFAR